jgi:RNA polymerase-binding transcription factor DksA
MTAQTKEQRALAARLEQERESTLTDLAQANSDIAALAADDAQEGAVPTNHPGDEGSDVYERERLQTVRAELEARLELIDAARERMADGTYGTCARCGKPIPYARLEALPWAQYDIECQSIMEGDDPANKRVQPMEPKV